jgi:hypothetical protein
MTQEEIAELVEQRERADHQQWPPADNRRCLHPTARCRCRGHGVSDLIQGQRLQSWRRDLSYRLAATRKAVSPTASVLSGRPQVDCLPALPDAVRSILAARAQVPSQTNEQVTTDYRSAYEALDTKPATTLFPTDRFNPSSDGYALTAQVIDTALSNATSSSFRTTTKDNDER